MPVMTKMRDSMPVVFAVLAGIFLITIIFQWGGQGNLFTSTYDGETLGTVNGRKISRKEYERNLQMITEKMKADGKKSALSEAEEEQAADKAWDQTVEQTLIEASMDKMGVVVTDQEVRDALFENPPQELRQSFIDTTTGLFNEKAYIQALRDPRNDSIVRVIETSKRAELRMTKWQMALVSSITVTDDEARTRYLIDSAKVDLQVVRFPAPPVTNDMAKQVSDDEAKAYYNAHLYQYKQEELRKFKFVAFREQPNIRDTMTTLETARTVAARLREAKPTEIDTVAKDLALDYSDEPAISSRLVSLRELGTDTGLVGKQIGDVAIASIAGKLSVVRVANTSDTGETLMHIRHVTIGCGRGPQGQVLPLLQATEAGRDSARALAAKLFADIQKGADFSEIARRYSVDTRSISKGGDMGWNDTSFYPNQFRKALHAAPVGGYVGPIDGPMGVEILQVTGRSSHKWTVSGVGLNIKASRQTIQLQQQMATIFHDQALHQGFEEAAKAAGYKVVTDAPPASKKGQPIFGSSTFINWISEASKNDICAPIRIPTYKFRIVAQLTEIIPEGPKPFEEVKGKIVEELARKKAVKQIAKSIAQFRAMVGPGGDLTQIAAQSRDSNLLPRPFTMGPAESVNGLTSGEYVINNWAYSAKVGDVSPVLEGNNGCYIAKLVATRIPSDAQFKDSRQAMMRNLLQERMQRMITEYIMKQKEVAKVVDFRVKH